MCEQVRNMIKTVDLIEIDRKIAELNAKSRRVSDKLAIIIYLTEKLEKQQKELEELLKGID